MWCKARHRSIELVAAIAMDERESRKKQQLSSWMSSCGFTAWPPRSYPCSFCRREFRSAQALGGHMNVHRRDRARLTHGSPPPPPPPPPPSRAPPAMIPNLNYPPPSSSSSTNKKLLDAPSSIEMELELELGVGVACSSDCNTAGAATCCTTTSTTPAAAGGGPEDDRALDLELRLGSVSSPSFHHTHAYDP